MAPMTRTPTLLLVVAVAIAVAPGLAAADEAPLCNGLAVNVLGTDGPDLIDLADGTHGSGPFVVATMGGADRVDGSEGADVVCLGDGDDIANLAGGDDAAFGEMGNDRLRGGPGADRLDGGPGDDRIFGGTGPDVLDGGDGADVIEGHDGNDLIRGGDGPDDITSGAGADDADGQAGDDVVRGNNGNDSLDGGSGNDLLRGGPGNDILDGDDAPAIVPISQAGVDEIYGGRGLDQLYANWTFYDGDRTGLLHGGADFDACALGGTQVACERDHRSSTDGGEEWRGTVADVFARWGLDTEACGTINGAEHCVGGPEQVDLALDILMCESSGWPFSYNTSSGASGLFQNLKGYWNERVAAAISIAATDGITTTLVPGADPFDPVANTEVAAYLVYTSRETLIGDRLYGFSGYPNNYGTTLPYYKSGWQRGPNPWGHWVCGGYASVGAWDPAWIHPNADPPS